MTEPPLSAETLLREGIAAAQADDRDRARACLLAVVESDESSVQAWYWLSRVVNSAEERLICLENVLVLDPGHQTVRAELAALRREQAAPPPAPYASRAAAQLAGLREPPVLMPGPASSVVVPSTPEQILISDAATEPLPCPACGVIAPPLDRACPACGRPLWARERVARGHSVYSLGLILVWIALATYAWLGLSFTYLGATLAAAVAASPRLSGVVAMLASFLGVHGPAVADLPMQAVMIGSGLAFVFSLAVAAGLAVRSRYFYWLTVGLTIVASLPILYQAAAAERLPLLRLAIGLLLFLVAMSLIFMAHDEFAWRERRLAAVVDPDVASDSALFARGRRYADQGQWARAAVHWARAVALSPSHSTYRLALATAYLNLQNPACAAEHIQAVLDLDPSNPAAREMSRIAAEAQHRRPIRDRAARL